jgi:hypothetical protein
MAAQQDPIRPRPDRAEPPLTPDPGTGTGDPEATLSCAVELENEDGERWVPRQQAVGQPAVIGSGEFADPATLRVAAAAPDSVDAQRTAATGDIQRGARSADIQCGARTR